MYLRRLLVLLVVGTGCAAQQGAVAHFPRESISIPDDADHYASDARPDGAVGGPGIERVQAEFASALGKRGERAEADGALSATASWALHEAHGGRALDWVGNDAAARHFGFGGVIIGWMAFDTQAKQDWDSELDKIPHNMPVTRYGIRLSPSGRSGVVVFGSMEASFTPITRAFEPGESVNLKGELGQRFKSCEVLLTKADGSGDKQPCRGRTFDAAFELSAPGVYRLEVMGDGPSGPVIVSMLPLFVGVPEPLAHGVTGTALDPDEAEARMLVLLNDARRSAGASPLQSDAELRELALGHSTDMADHHFVGHVSPSTGAPEDRARRAGLLAALFGENIAASATPEVAHEGLMNSPGHRANMLQPLFTHVGIGVRKSETGIIVTMNFARRPAPNSVPTSAAQVEAAISDLRARKGLGVAKIDPVYCVAAQAGADAYAGGKSGSDISKAVTGAVQREADRLHIDLPGTCIMPLDLLELRQLEDLPNLTKAAVRRFGVGARLRKDSKGTRLSTVILLDAVFCD